LQRDWNKESAKHMGRAASTVNFSDKQRTFCLQKMSQAAKVTNESDFRVDKALKSKIAETTKLRDLIEDSIESTNEEISKMNAIKKYLVKEREAADKQFQHSVERRAHRSLRPPRELVHDVPYKELKKQTALLQATTDKFKKKYSSVDEVIGQLKSVRHTLAKDLEDKRSALTLDKKCIDMVSGGKSLDGMENHGTTGLPYGWKRDTLQTVDEAEEVKRQATKLRKICFGTSHKRQTLARDQHDHLQASFQARMKDIGRIKEKLEEQLVTVEDEISKALKVKKKLGEAIAEKLPPMDLARSRYALRLKRPHREAIHDKVEHALLLQVNELQDVVKDLQFKEKQVTEHIHSLERTKKELKRNIQDKEQNLKLEHTCFNMAPSRPTTGYTLNTDALSLRPATASTLGGFTLNRSRRLPGSRSGFNHRSL